MKINIIENEYYNNRKILIKALTGSYNYGTNDETSDKDFKIFLLPTFDDLYNSKQISCKPEIKEDGNDYDYKDIRLLLKQFQKANISYLEILASKEVWIDKSFINCWNKIIALRHDIANSNLSGMLNAIKGMCYEKRMAIFKDLPNETTNEGYNRKLKFGFDTKQLLHIFRLHIMLKNIYDSSFLLNSILDTIYLSEYERKFLLNIKYNIFQLDKETALIESDKVIKENQEIINRYLNGKDALGFLSKIKCKNVFEVLENLIKKFIESNLPLINKVKDTSEFYGAVKDMPKGLKPIIRQHKEYVNDNDTWVSCYVSIENIWNYTGIRERPIKATVPEIPDKLIGYKYEN